MRMDRQRPVGVRWTIGQVSRQGFETLRLSIWGAWKVFGPDARYAVCVNSVPLDAARDRTGDVPAEVAWHDVTDRMPAFLRAHLDGAMAEGVGWKFGSSPRCACSPSAMNCRSTTTAFCGRCPMRFGSGSPAPIRAGW